MNTGLGAPVGALVGAMGAMGAVGAVVRAAGWAVWAALVVALDIHAHSRKY